MKRPAPKIFVINPGSTSTKVALFAGGKSLFEAELTHARRALDAFGGIMAQADFRRQAALDALADHGAALEDIDVFIGRGGLLRPVSGGVYKVNRKMLNELRRCTHGEHASNLGAIIAADLAARYGKAVYIADPVAVDELSDVARISGHPDLPRRSIFHALSHKAVAEKAAARLGKAYRRCNLIVVHLGGGVTVGAHRRGAVVDVNHGLEGEGPFTPERTGAMALMPFLRYVREKRLSHADAEKLITRQGGLLAHLGTNDCRRIEQKVAAGNRKFALVYDAFIYSIAKQIGAMAAALCGKVDAIVLTGGVVRGKLFLRKLRGMVRFIAPIHVIMDSEMEALAAAALAVATGKKKAKVY